MRIVDGNELDARLLQSEEEVGVARKPIEASNDQLGVEGAAGLECTSERRAIVVTLAALDFNVLLDELPRAAVQIVKNRLALGLKPKAAFTLPLGRNAQV
jgi:hypothetical protein